MTNSSTNHEGDNQFCLVIAGKEYTQSQVATVAFNSYYHSGRTIEAGFITWKKLTRVSGFTIKDFAFLVLYFLDKLATDKIKEIFESDINKIKKYTDPHPLIDGVTNEPSQ